MFSLVQEFFLELGVTILLATALGLVFVRLKQPLILAYLITGVFLGSAVLNAISADGITHVFSELGIVFLLFLAGLNLNVNVLKEVGRASIITGIGQIAFTSAIGFVILLALGFKYVEAAYLAVAITFSSTIIIVKLLSDKNELDSLHGKISVGFLLVQDIVAIAALILISSMGTGADLASVLSSFLLKAAAFFIIAVMLAKFAVEKIFYQFAKSQELLFLSSISWMLLLVLVSQVLGFSSEIGAFIAGVTLASIPYSFEIAGKIKYLRDFFLVLFFVLLGSQLVFSSIAPILPTVLLISLFILVGNPVIVISLMLFLGYKGKTAFLCGLTVAQISEFSLVLIALGVKVGHIPETILPVITLVGIITISISSYFILHSHAIYGFFSRFIEPFERKKKFEDALSKGEAGVHKIILVGFNRTGKSVVDGLKAPKESILVVDYNPAIVKKAISSGFHAVYGDVSEPEVLNFLKTVEPEIIVSTVKEFGAQAGLLKAFPAHKKPFMIVFSDNVDEAKKLALLNPDMVVVPPVLAGKIVKDYVNRALQSKGLMDEVKQMLLDDLKKY
ncbi:MAG TPA: cation:proton antiporter [archaeon]|nr:cation:proton antiporter [archaeon]